MTTNIIRNEAGQHISTHENVLLKTMTGYILFWNLGERFLNNIADLRNSESVSSSNFTVAHFVLQQGI